MAPRFALILTAILMAACAPKPEAAVPAAASGSSPPAPAPAPTSAGGWTSLFDGKTLGDWTVTQFGTQGEVQVKDGTILVNYGDGLSGVSWNKPETLPTIDYEIALDAMRVDGADFFCGLTFPYHDSSATLICGGWGGSLVGISSLDRQDAAHNDTTSIQGFDDNHWYAIRVRVTDAKLEAWIDKEKVVDVEIMGRKVAPRGDIELAAPLGLSTYTTTGAFKNIRIRKLTPGER